MVRNQISEILSVDLTAYARGGLHSDGTISMYIHIHIDPFHSPCRLCARSGFDSDRAISVCVYIPLHGGLYKILFCFWALVHDSVLFFAHPPFV